MSIAQKKRNLVAKPKQVAQKEMTVSKSMQNLKIADQEQIGAYIKHTQAYFDNRTKDMGANPAERKMQEKCSARQREKQKKRIDILTEMLYKNNKCNYELGKQVENGNLQFFDCPPILYSPHNNDDLN